MTTENNAAQPGLTDELSIAINMLISDAKALAHVKAKGYDASDAERCFQVAQDRVCTMLSKLRAEGVQAGDERAAFVAWLTGAYPDAYSEPEAMRLWHHEHVAALAWEERGRRAALASAPVADERAAFAAAFTKETGIELCADGTFSNADDRQTYETAQWAWNTRAALASAPVSNPIQWPTMPASKGQSPVLFEDGYAEGWAKCMDECRRAVSQASSPVAGEAQTSDADILALSGQVMAAHSDGRGYDAGVISFARALLARYAAPQASEAVRNAALEEAASMCESWKMDRPRVSAEAVANQTMVRMARYIRALKAQADKDGGDCAKGAGDGQPKYWLCCGSTEPEHRNRRAPDCFNADRAKWGTADQHSVVKQSLTATQTGEKGESDAG